MKLPRDLSGHELAKLLRKYGREHHLSIPAHHILKVGIVAGILGDVAAYLGRRRSEIETELFGS